MATISEVAIFTQHVCTGYNWIWIFHHCCIFKECLMLLAYGILLSSILELCPEYGVLKQDETNTFSYHSEKILSLHVCVYVCVRMSVCVCVVSVACQLSPCLHGGTCLPEGEGYGCFCPQGFTGESCEIGETQISHSYSTLMLLLKRQQKCWRYKKKINKMWVYTIQPQSQSIAFLPAKQIHCRRSRNIWSLSSGSHKKLSLVGLIVL